MMQLGYDWSSEFEVQKSRAGERGFMKTIRFRPGFCLHAKYDVRMMIDAPTPVRLVLQGTIVIGTSAANQFGVRLIHDPAIPHFIPSGYKISTH
tara:strand:+ start:10900 stop:11181 length:282 start_codon:yes stop_codon:yes gene_type:complete